MRAAIRKMGNSNGVILPKPILSQLGLRAGDSFEMTLDEGRLILVPSPVRPRHGWAEAAQQISAEHDDSLVWPEFGNADDETLRW